MSPIRSVLGVVFRENFFLLEDGSRVAADRLELSIISILYFPFSSTFPDLKEMAKIE